MIGEDQPVLGRTIAPRRRPVLRALWVILCIVLQIAAVLGLLYGAIALSYKYSANYEVQP